MKYKGTTYYIIGKYTYLAHNYFYEFPSFPGFPANHCIINALNVFDHIKPNFFSKLLEL